MEVLEKQLKARATVETDYLQLYEELFPVCARWVRSMNGSLNDAEDIFQDALVIYFEKKETTITTSPDAYILGITKHLWIRKFEKSKSIVSLTDLEKTLTIPESFFPSINTVRLLDFLESTGRNCLELLRTFYYEKLSVKELCSKMGYRSQHSATVQKYKCIEKLRTSIKQRSLSYEDFTE
jgi:DNA-directed RNA polymerase specialized sigma24 family protein